MQPESCREKLHAPPQPLSFKRFAPDQLWFDDTQDRRKLRFSRDPRTDETVTLDTRVRKNTQQPVLDLAYRLRTDCRHLVTYDIYLNVGDFH